MEADDLILISVDDHISEPADMFENHVPEKYKELAPRVVAEANGTQQWYYGDIRGRNLGLNAVAGKPKELYNLDASRYEDMRPGCYDVHERVRDMNAGGTLGGLNFPNFTGFSGQVLNQAIAVLISWSLAIVGTLIILKICDAVMGVRATKEQELEGLDISMHGEEGYNLEA